MYSISVTEMVLTLSIVRIIILKYVFNVMPSKYIDISFLYDANESRKYRQEPEELLTMGRSSFRDVTTLTVFVLRLSTLPLHNITLLPPLYLLSLSP